ncbi:MAG: hypothetical protein GEU79_11195 [Acidimicrobiia bacterium]|nr:hypothetical protein [Acidimicrobiia bacterium]
MRTRRHKALIGLLVMGLVATALPVLAFDDVPPSHIFADDIRAVEAAGITLGCNPPENTRYCPDRAVTRAQMATFLVRGFDLPPAENHFTDDDGNVHEDDIAALAKAGVTFGCNPPDNTRYCPNWSVTRGQMATFLVRGLDLPPAENHFTDDDGSVHEDDIAALAKAEITLGCNPPANTRYCPDQPVRRGQMAAFLRRALELPVPPAPEGTVIDLVERQQWGAAPPEGSFTDHTITHLTLHHAASPPSPTGPEAFRGWQSYHQSLGWGDIAYHFIVGKDGRVYEGRDWTKVGDTATEYDPTAHFLVVVEGNFDNEEPTQVQLEAIAKILAYGAQESGVDPHEILGHRDHASTSCPGDALYLYVHDGSLATMVADYLNEGPITLE